MVTVKSAPAVAKTLTTKITAAKKLRKPELTITGNGRNLDISEDDDFIYIKVAKAEECQTSSTGRSQILASTAGWVGVTNLSGKNLKDKDLGINLTVTLRPKKVPKA